jgi:hypothetical protein
VVSVLEMEREVAEFMKSARGIGSWISGLICFDMIVSNKYF